MSYQQATVPVPEKLAEAFSDALMEQGALCSTIEDAYAGTEQEQPIFGEPGMPAQQVWQQSQVTALFDTAADPAAALAAAAEQIGTPSRSSTPSKFPRACGLPPPGTIRPIPQR